MSIKWIDFLCLLLTLYGFYIVHTERVCVCTTQMSHKWYKTHKLLFIPVAKLQRYYDNNMQP